MDSKQHENLLAIRSGFVSLITDKYEKGVAEHGGNGWEMPTHNIVDNAKEEVVDLVVYLDWVRMALDDIYEIALNARELHPALDDICLRIEGNAARK